MSKAYADALKYFRTKLKAGPEPEPMPRTTGASDATEVMQHDSGEAKLVASDEGAKKVPEVREAPSDLTGKKAADPLTDGGVKQTSEDSGNPATAMELPEPWEWSHLMSREEFLKRDPWRQQQLIAQWEENVALGGVWTPVLRGGIKNRNCFRGCPSYQCTCEDNL